MHREHLVAHFVNAKLKCTASLQAGKLKIVIILIISILEAALVFGDTSLWNKIIVNFAVFLCILFMFICLCLMDLTLV